MNLSQKIHAIAGMNLLVAGGYFLGVMVMLVGVLPEQMQYGYWGFDTLQMFTSLLVGLAALVIATAVHLMAAINLWRGSRLGLQLATLTAFTQLLIFPLGTLLGGVSLFWLMQIQAQVAPPAAKSKRLGEYEEFFEGA